MEDYRPVTLVVADQLPSQALGPAEGAEWTEGTPQPSVDLHSAENSLTNGCMPACRILSILLGATALQGNLIIEKAHKAPLFGGIAETILWKRVLLHSIEISFKKQQLNGACALGHLHSDEVRNNLVQRGQPD